MKVIAPIVLTALVLATSVAAQVSLGRPGGPFSIEWNLEKKAPGSSTISGYVTNEYGRPVKSVRLLVEAFDASNQVIARRYEWVGGVIGGRGRVYFEVNKVPAADHYTVMVHSYDIIDSPGRGRFGHFR